MTPESKKDKEAALYAGNPRIRERMDPSTPAHDRVETFLRQTVDAGDYNASHLVISRTEPAPMPSILVRGSTASHGWGSKLLDEGLTFISATKTPSARVTFEWKVAEAHTNRMGNAHGGCTATIFDFCTSCALIPIARPGFWVFVGVSRTLNVTYIRPMPTGETIVIECEVLHAGKNLATVSGVMKRKSDGAIMATCEHGKVNVDALFSKL